MRNVLIVDDMLVNRRLIKNVLKPIDGLSFHEASDGRQALNAVLTKEIDIILLDLVMPVMDGFEVLREVKQELKLGIPIIVNSAIDQSDALRRALELGAYDYFTKPLSPEQMNMVLPLKVRNALASYEQSKTLQQLNSRLQEEMQLAAVLQRSLLEQPGNDCGADVFKFYQPSDYLAGDLILCEKIGDVTWVLSADVCGHGVASALLASMEKAIFSHMIRTHTDPAEILSFMNHEFSGWFKGEHYFTALLGKIEGHTFTYANGGHPAPFVLRKGEGLISLEQRGFPVGLLEDADYSVRRFELQPRDMLLTFTDGFTSNLVFNEHFATTQDILSYMMHKVNDEGVDGENFKQLLLDLAKRPLNDPFRDDVALMLMTIE